MSPVDFESFAGAGLHAHKGAAGSELRTNVADIFLQDAVPAAVAERPQPLFESRRQ